MITITLEEFKGKLQNLPLHPYAEPLYYALSEAVNEVEANKQYRGTREETIYEIEQLLALNAMMQYIILGELKILKYKITNPRHFKHLYAAAYKAYLTELERFREFDNDFISLDSDIAPYIVEVVYEQVKPCEWQFENDFYTVDSLWKYKVLGKLPIAETYRYKDRTLTLDELRKHERILNSCLNEAKKIMTEVEMTPLINFVAKAIRMGIPANNTAYRGLYDCLTMFNLISVEQQDSHKQNLRPSAKPNYVRAIYNRAKKESLI